jgi:hypothetical protein
MLTGLTSDTDHWWHEIDPLATIPASVVTEAPNLKDNVQYKESRMLT